ncbi:diguanylate cyclase domain-containing protein [Actinomycetospora rhizophila]|uniref:Diguanylate cyclase domain-containing protein n=1 Tax=Actinomycetospora rhizophila TaxID=1416876 RepID=A0ABV9Z9G8_9PSEU
MRRAPRLIHEVQRLGLTVSIAALLIVLLVVFRLVWSVAVTAPADQRLQDGLLALEDSHQAMLDMDASLRGYLATGDRFFTDSATDAAPRLAAADSQMVNLLEEPQLRQDVLALLLAQQRWRTEWADQARRLPPPGGAETFLKQGTALFDDYRARKDGTRVDVLDAIESADADAVVAQWVIGVLIAVIGIGTLVVALRGRQRLQRHVVTPVDGLLASVRGIGEGRLTPPEPVSGSAELVALRDGLADMTVALRRQREEAAAQAERLQSQTDRLRTILIMTREIAGSLNTRYVIDSTVQAAVAVTDGRVLLWLLEEDGNGLELAYDSDRGAVSPMETHCNLGVGVVGRSARYGQISRGDPDTGEDAAVAVPLVVGARVIGILECYDSPDGEVDGQRLSAVEMLATLSGSAIEASRLHAATERLSQFDPLTQLANRRRLGADLDAAVANAKRHSSPMSVIMLDLDHFKELNDRYGHQQGDVVLQEVASTLRTAMRDGETAYRYGGEEFAILVTRGGPDDAAKLAERLRVRVEEDFRRGDKQLVTASFGVAGLPEHAGDGEALLSEADRALYSAKNAGRNRVHRAGGLVD